MTGNKQRFCLKLLMVLLLLATSSHQTVCAQAGVSKFAPEEKALRTQSDQYAAAFAEGDAKAIANMWTKDGTFIDSDGNETRGQQQIEKLYSSFFTQHGGQPLAITIESLRFPAANVAVEEGVSRLLQSTNPSTGNRYTAVNVKTDGKWLMCNVTETPYAPAHNSEYLSGLSWLVGDWTASGDTGKVHFKVRWVADKNFILCTFRPDTAKGDKVSDAQMIGWDPIHRCIFSATFGASGGFGQSHWSRDGKSWLLKSWSVEPDGTRAEATYRLSQLDQNSFTWQSTSRTINGASASDTTELKVLRDSTNK